MTLKIGDAISVAFLGDVIPAEINTVGAHRFGDFTWHSDHPAVVLTATWLDPDSSLFGSFYDSEGARWCRGHSGDAVEALRAAAALLSDAPIEQAGSPKGVVAALARVAAARVATNRPPPPQ